MDTAESLEKRVHDMLHGTWADTLKASEEITEVPTTAHSPSANEAANDSAVDIVYVYCISEKQAGTYPRLCGYDYSYHHPIRSYTKKKCSGTPEPLTELLGDVYKERETLGRTTTPLIWVVEGDGARYLCWMQQALDLIVRDSELQGVNNTWAENISSTYGVVVLNGDRPRFPLAWFLVWCQFQCLNTIGVYEKGDKSRAPIPIKWLPVSLMREPRFLALCILGYCWAGVMAYRINRNDYYQRWCVATGLAIGFFLFQFALKKDDTWPTLLYLSATMAAGALELSMIGHGVWRYWFSHRTRDKRVERVLVQLKREARGMGKDTRILKFYNVV